MKRFEFQQVDVSFEHDGQYLSAKEAAKQQGAGDFHDPSPSSVDDQTSGRRHDHD